MSGDETFIMNRAWYGYELSVDDSGEAFGILMRLFSG
jgi:hypothetical protein